MITVRQATADDARFLEEMLAVAADWRPGTPARPVAEVLAVPELAHYIADWPRNGDFGFVARDGTVNVGAVWCRLFTREDPGYGFVDEDTPELSIGVVQRARGLGVGTRLLGALIDQAKRSPVPALSLSLSVEPDNPAAWLYGRLGFKPVDRVGGAITMVLPLRS